MNCFQLVKIVLDEIYTEIPLPGEPEKDAAISKELKLLSERYANLASGITVDYENAVTRFAYIYRYVTSHANIVYDIIRGCSELTELMNSDKVTMTCFGGGPGSDFLGVLKYLINHGKNPTLRCTLYDREEAWGESWSDVDNKLETQLRISTFFQRFDVAEPKTWENHSKYLNSDLFTMVYFMSEVFSIKDRAELFFENFFSKAKEGSFSCILIIIIKNFLIGLMNWQKEILL